MHDSELSFYANLELGADSLVDLYKQKGLIVERVPWEDPHHKKSSQKTIKKTKETVCSKALALYDKLPKPILLHCSAGIDRSSPVASFLAKARGKE